MAIIKRIVHILSIICYLLIVIYGLICVPLIFKYKPLVVLTGSMEPTFKTGSIIYYKSVSEDELKVGDIITFKYDESLISHRIYSIDNSLYETKGDANNTPDATRINYSNIVGKDANVSIPYLGYFVKYVNENMYLLIIVGIILLSEFILSNIKTKKSHKEESNA